MWLLKPTCMNRGNGIHVFSSFKKLKKLVRDYCKRDEHYPFESNGIQWVDALGINHEGKVAKYIKQSGFIIQKYIEQPLLINNRKFDIRVWVMVT